MEGQEGGREDGKGGWKGTGGKGWQGKRKAESESSRGLQLGSLNPGRIADCLPFIR